MPGQLTQTAPWLRRLAVAVLFLIPLLLALRLIFTGVSLDTDVQAILPEEGVRTVEITAIRHAGSAVAARLVLGVRGGTAEQRARAADSLQKGLQATGLFVPASHDAVQMRRWISANRFELACAADPSAMDAAWGRQLARKARTAIFGGMVPLDGIDLTADPFLVELHLLSCLTEGFQSPATSQDMARVAGRLSVSPYQLDVQERIGQVIDSWRQTPEALGLTLLRGGALFFAEAAATRARHEIALVGGASLVLILLLYTLAFRRPGSAGLALMTVAAGALGGGGLCFALFGQVHFSVFVFGSALTGISADYAVHSLAARRAAMDGTPRLQRALTISMLTSVCGFSALLFFDIALFRQIGVFAMGGLASAWLFALLALPRLDRRAGSGTQRRWPILRSSGAASLAALVAIAILAGLGLSRLEIVDDLRRFQAQPAQLVADQQALHTGDRLSNRFLLSSGPDRQAALQAEEANASDVGALKLSRLDPSALRRAAHRQAYETRLFAPHLAAWQGTLGIETVARPEANGSADRPDLLDAFAFQTEGQTHLIAPLAEEADPAGQGIIDPVQLYGDVLANYRVTALQTLGVAALLALLFLLAVYRSVAGLLLILPPLAGCLMALALPGLLGLPVTLFSVLALFIVLGTGIDFSIFQWEMRRDRSGWTGAAVLIAAASTCLAMGLLGFSHTLPVQSFGVTIAIGVSVSMGCSFLIPRPQPKDLQS